MNREYKFRVWDKKQKKLSFVTEIYWSSGEICTLEGELLPWDENLVLMQFTGLKDAKGKEIYEGDVVGEKGYCFPVIFEDAAFHIGNSQTLIEWIWARQRRGIETEVIGNIYENPEFLKR